MNGDDYPQTIGNDPIIYQNDKCAVVAQDRGYELVIKVYHKKDGKIFSPLGYMVGSNFLAFEYNTKGSTI